MGLHVVYEPPPDKKPTVDILCVHSFGEKGQQIWTANDGTMWIRDLLPLYLPFARIVIFDYDSTADVIPSTKSMQWLDDLAERLFREIHHLSERNDEQIPLVFLSHALGGLLVKKAVVTLLFTAEYKTIVHRIRAILFFGTPNRAARYYSDWPQVLRNTFSWDAGFNEELVRALHVSTGEILSRFAQIRFENTEIYTFYETKRSIKNLTLAVPQSSAVLDFPNEVQIALNADHRSMVKFNAVSDPGFIRVLSVLEDTLQIVREDAALQVPQGLISNNTEELKFDETEESQYFKHFKSVGQGGFGFVDIVEAVIEKEGKPKLLEGDAERSASRRYARKTVPIMDNVPLLKLADLRREAENLKKVIHRHIAKLELDYLKENDKGKIFFVLITSPYANGDMRNFLVHKRIFAVEPWEHYHRQQVLRWFGCLARAVQFLHKHNIRHMDIKPENILVHAENVLLTDFGISKDMSSSFDGRTRGPLSVEKGEYFAPEIIQKQERGYESDIFSLGCVFLEMLTDFCGIKYSELHKELEDSHKKAQAVCNVCKDDPSRKEDRFDYHHHPVKTLQWLFSLVTKCDKNDFWANKDDHSMRPLRLAPLDWTFAMLQPDEKHRVKTDALVKAIHAVEEATKSSKIALALPTNGALEVFICGDCSEDTVAPSIKHSVASMKLSKGLPWVADVVPRSWDDANASLRWVDPHDRGPSDAG